jgi:hypothetical protein
MARQAIQRALLVVALIGLAHALKPISARSVADHFLQTTRSLSFILPESAVHGVEQANFLAAALGHGSRGSEAQPAPDPAASVEADLAAWQEPALVEAGPAPRASAKRQVRAKRELRRERGGEVACSLKAPAIPAGLTLPVGLAIEKAQALNLPAIEAAVLPLYSHHLLSRPVKAPRPPRRALGCESPRLKQIRVALLSEEAQLKLRASLQHLIESASSGKVQVRTTATTTTTTKANGFNLKCS